MGFSICLCTCVCVCMVNGQMGGMFIWLIRIGYIHGGFESKCPVVTIIESAWGLFYGDYLNQFLALGRIESEAKACT